MESVSVGWFVAFAGLGLLSGCFGWLAGRGPGWLGRLTLASAFVLLLTWVWLVRNPAVAVQALPVSTLSRIEGVGCLPMFMVVMGVAWARARELRQKHLVGWATTVGLVYFLQGGVWLLQPTPLTGLATTTRANGVVFQSQAYSCVPAACASALSRLGIKSSEAEMAQLTMTRPGTGSTTLRAMHGLNHRLANTGLAVRLVSVNYDRLRVTQMPALTPLRLRATSQHMVTLLRVDPGSVLMADPTLGRIRLPREQFVSQYTGWVLAFDRLSGPSLSQRQRGSLDRPMLAGR